MAEEIRGSKSGNYLEPNEDGGLDVKQSGSIVAKWENNDIVVGKDDRYFGKSVGGYDDDIEVLDISMYRQKYIFLNNDTDVSLELGFKLYASNNAVVKENISIQSKIGGDGVSCPSGSKAIIDITNEDYMELNCEGLVVNIRGGDSATEGDIDLIVGGGY